MARHRIIKMLNEVDEYVYYPQCRFLGFFGWSNYIRPDFSDVCFSNLNDAERFIHKEIKLRPTNKKYDVVEEWNG